MNGVCTLKQSFGKFYEMAGDGSWQWFVALKVLIGWLVKHKDCNPPELVSC